MNSSSMNGSSTNSSSMSDHDRDVALSGLFQAAFRLSRAEEDAFWRQFETRRTGDRQAWKAFHAVMAHLQHRLEPATQWLHRPTVWIPAH